MILWLDASSFQLHGLGMHGMSAADVGHLTVCGGSLNSDKYGAFLKTHMLPSPYVLSRQGQN